MREAARSKAEALDEQTVSERAKELVREAGAFPDRSIVSAYQGQPALGKLPDYIVARAIESIIG